MRKQLDRVVNAPLMSGPMKHERTEELGVGLIEGIGTLATSKKTAMGAGCEIQIRLPLNFEGVDYVVTIETKADHEARDA